MKEIAQIIDAYEKIDFAVQKAALATVVHVEGSSYRRAGARMLITNDGKLTGAISGGCLEGDALRKALLVMHRGEAMVVTYDTTDEDDAKLGIGLGCNGIIHILIEPILPDNLNNPLQLLINARCKRQRAILITLFSFTNKRSSPPGTSFLLAQEGEEYTTIQNADLLYTVKAEAEETLAKHSSSYKEFKKYQLNAFVELLRPTIRLVIFGAGNDVVPVTEIANVLGWETIVIDGRATHAKTDRFPLASQVNVAKPEQAAGLIQPDEQTYFLLMTHNYNYDLAIFSQLIKRNVKYIGVLGPRKKVERMIEEVPAKTNDLSSVYGPVGLDIGAETAEEIALSIISEIKAVSAQKSAGYLKDKQQAIHSHSSKFSSYPT